MKSYKKWIERENEISESLNVWMQFCLDHKYKFATKDSDNDDIEIIWLKSFKFKKNDILTIEELFIEGELERVIFSVERNWKKVQDSDGNELSFKFSRIIFVHRFHWMSDMEDICNNTQKKVADLL